MTGSHQGIRNLLTRVAQENQEQGVDCIEQDQAPDTGVDRNEQRQISLPGRRKDSEVLKKD